MTPEQMREYASRLRYADNKLRTMAKDEAAHTPGRSAHLLSKAEGVRLALSYLREMHDDRWDGSDADVSQREVIGNEPA